MDNIPSTITYTDDFEILLKDESEKAESMSILHSMANQKYNYLSIFMNIPVIIISSIIGFMSPLTLFENQAIFLGSLSILVSVLKTMDNFFDWTKRSEGHRMTALNYYKISKFIQIQLSLEKEYRIMANDLLSIITNDLQNLKDSEPPITQDLIDKFNKKYKNDDTSKPPITNGLTKVKINKKSKNGLPTPKSDIKIEIPKERLIVN